MNMSLEVCVKEEGAKDRRNLKLFLDRVDYKPLKTSLYTRW